MGAFVPEKVFPAGTSNSAWKRVSAGTAFPGAFAPTWIVYDRPEGGNPAACSAHAAITFRRDDSVPDGGKVSGRQETFPKTD